MMDQRRLPRNAADQMEAGRLAALRHYQILDTLPEPAFDRLTRLAAQICSVPAAVINLIDADRQWSKSCSDGSQPDAIPRALSFCAHTIRSKSTHVVPDTRDDPRFVDNPFVTAPGGIRFYAGAPIRTPDGHALGSLCIIDVVPRALTPAQEGMLLELAAIVMDTLELRLQLVERRTLEAERAAAHARAAASEAKYKTLFQVLPIGVSVADPVGRIVEVNPASERLLGIRADQQLARQVDSSQWRVIGPDGNMLPPDQYASVRVLREDRLISDVELGVVRPDGQTTWLSVTATPLPLPQGGALIAYHDISRRWQVEQALRASEEKYRSFVEQSAEGFLLTDEQGQVIEFNRSLAAQTGLSQGDVLGHFIWEVQELLAPRPLSPQERRYLRGQFTAALETGTAAILNHAVNAPYRGADGRERVVQQTLFAIKTERGYRLGGISRDITHLQQAEQALRESEERLSLVLDGSNDGFWDWNVATGDVTFSPRWAEMLGYTLDEVEPHVRSWERLVHPDDLPLVMDTLNAHFAGRTAHYEIEHRVLNKAGAWQWILDRGRVVARSADGTPLRMAGTHTDITERKRAEAEQLAWERRMQETQRLESLGVLAGGVAHDFNNLLTSILGHAELVRCDVPAGSETAASIAEVISGAQRAAELSNQMLAYSGRGKFVIEPVDFSELAREMAHLLRVSIPKHVRLQTELRAALPSIEADVTQMRQILLNLVTNAAEALGEGGGEVQIVTAVDDLSSAALATLQFGTGREPGRYVRLTVTDTGCGMDEATMGRIFDPFFTTKFTGRGLGLAAVQGIVRGHHGMLDVTSAPGRGTSFSIWFPILPARLAEQNDVAAAVGRRTILVIDDEERVRTLLTRMLQRVGWQAQVAATGPDGLELLADGIAGLAGVLVDLTMPELSGEAVAQAIQSDYPDLPIILMSGYSAESVALEYPHLRVAGFLQKPFTLTTLNDLIAGAFPLAGV